MGAGRRRLDFDEVSIPAIYELLSERGLESFVDQVGLAQCLPLFIKINSLYL